MRLSEAIMLGAATCKMTAGDWNSCAYGSAMNALGVRQMDVASVIAGDTPHRFFTAMKLWPWISTDGQCPTTLGASVYKIFDHSVCQGKMTLEQLVDYVRSVEPDCDCNRFNCDCKAEQEAIAEVEYAHQT